MIHVRIDKIFPDAAFLALCNRPCKSIAAVIPTGGFTASAGGSSKANPNLIALKLDLPRAVSVDETVDWEVRSNDDEEIAIIKVEAIRQW